MGRTVLKQRRSSGYFNMRKLNLFGSMRHRATLIWLNVGSASKSVSRGQHDPIRVITIFISVQHLHRNRRVNVPPWKACFFCVLIYLILDLDSKHCQSLLTDIPYTWITIYTVFWWYRSRQKNIRGSMSVLPCCRCWRSCSRGKVSHCEEVFFFITALSNLI